LLVGIAHRSVLRVGAGEDRDLAAAIVIQSDSDRFPRLASIQSPRSFGFFRCHRDASFFETIAAPKLPLHDRRHAFGAMLGDDGDRR